MLLHYLHINPPNLDIPSKFLLYNEKIISDRVVVVNCYY